jgi:hypothetical protein
MIEENVSHVTVSEGVRERRGKVSHVTVSQGLEEGGGKGTGI